MKKILFTGFEPFDGAATNPSWDAVSLLPEEIDGCRISRILLPVEYDSYTAGTYVCNSLMYHLMHLLAQKYPSVIGGFIHIPFDCTQVAASGKTSYPSLPLSTSAEGLKAAALAVGKALDEGSQDIREASGYTH